MLRYPIGRSRAKANCAGKQQGFTLFEILVVMVVIAIVTAATVLSINPDNSHRELEREAQRFFQIMRMLGDEAVLQNREFGLQVFEDGYSFLVFDYDVNQWVDYAEEDIFQPYQIPQSMSLVLYSEDLPFKLGKSDQDQQTGGDQMLAEEVGNEAENSALKKQKEPNVWLLSSGEITPFEVEMALQENSLDRYKIATDEQGQLSLHAPENEDD